jgi:hypothetical protein
VLLSLPRERTTKKTLSHAFPPVAEQRRRERQDTIRSGRLVQPPLLETRQGDVSLAVEPFGEREREKTPEGPL